MKQVRLLLMAGLFAFGMSANADTAVLSSDDGWQKITAMPSDVTGYYYCIVANDQDLMLSLARGKNQGNGYNGLYYKTSGNPIADKSMLFTLQTHSDCLVMTNAEYNGYFLQTEWNAAHNYRTHDNGGGSKDWGKVKFTYQDGGFWTIQNGQYPVDDGNYLGVWNDDGSADNGVELALNKPSAKRGTFQIYAISKDDYNTLVNNIKAGTGASESNPVDMTALIVNPNAAFWTGSIPFGWTTTGTQNVNTGAGPDGFPGFFEYSNWNANSWTGSVEQTIAVPNGIYRLTVNMMAATGVTAYIYANDDHSENLNAIGATWGELTVETTVTTGSIKIGTYAEASAQHLWVNADNFRLEYLGSDLSILKQAYANALAAAQAVDQTQVMSAATLAALQSAISTYGSGVDQNSESDLQTAIDALNGAVEAVSASVSAYEGVAAYLAKMGGVLDNTNVYTQDSYNQWYGNVLTGYNNKTLTDAQAVQYTEAKAFGSGWHQNQGEGYIDNILLSTWTIGGEQCNKFDKALYINNWSVEGNTDGSEFRAPFFEYWTSDGNSLGANTLQSTVVGLEANSVYSFTIRARVRQKDGNDAKIENGITMQVGDGTPVDISSGAQFNGGQFYIGNFSAKGSTDADGKLTVTITVAENSNISWLSFYNCKVTEGEDLSAYIADYEFARNQIDLNIYAETLQALLGDDYTAYVLANPNEATKEELIAATQGLNKIIPTISQLTGSSNANWTTTGNNGEFRVNTWSGEGETDGSGMKTPFIQNWIAKGTTLTNATMTTTLSGLKANAYYKVSGLVRTLNEAGTVSEDGSSNPVGSFIYAGAGIARAYNGTTCTNGVYANPVVYGQADAEGNLEIGIKVIKTNCNWVSWKNITVVEASENITAEIAAALVAEARTFDNNTAAQATEDAATSALTSTLSDANYKAAGAAIEAAYRDYVDVSFAALDAAIAAAQTKLDGCTPLGFQAGEYAPYNLVALTSAIATAEAFDRTQELKQADIDAATTALTTATAVEIAANTEEVSAIDLTKCFDGSADGSNRYYALGWGKAGGTDAYNTRIISGSDGNAGMSAVDNELALFTKFGTTYGTEEGFTMPLAANTIYKISFKYGAWGENKEIVTNLALASADGETEITITPASFTRENNTGLANESTEAWFDYEGYFTIETAGNYVLTLTKDDNGQQRQIVMGNIDIRSYELQTAELTLASSGFTSWVTTFDVDFSELDGVAAYIVQEEGVRIDDLKIDMEQIYNAKAGTPVIFKGTASTPFTLTETLESVTDWTDVNQLKSGTEAGPTITDDNYGKVLMFSKGEFKRCANGINLNPAKAYLVLDEVLPASTNVNFFADFGDGEANAINGIVDAASAPKAIYNLQGQKVNAPVKGGVYIIDGKKVLVK